MIRKGRIVRESYSIRTREKKLGDHPLIMRIRIIVEQFKKRDRIDETGYDATHSKRLKRKRWRWGQGLSREASVKLLW